MPEDAEVVLVGGRNEALKDHLRQELADAQIQTDGAVPGLDASDPDNIANRTRLGMGAQLELSGGLRKAMFDAFTTAHRRDTTTDLFWTFTEACRNAVARLEVTQIIL